MSANTEKETDMMMMMMKMQTKKHKQMHQQQQQKKNEAEVQSEKRQTIGKLTEGRARVRQKCTLGCPLLDRFMEGGVACGSVTEIVGECGVGKTQMCLQLLLCSQMQMQMQMPIQEQQEQGQSGGLGAPSLYIHTQSYVPLRRLQQLSHFFSSDMNADPCDQVFVKGVHTIDELLLFLDNVELQLRLSRPPLVKLMAIDSVAALFRSDFGNTAAELKKRCGFFFRLSSQLKRMAAVFDLAVVVTNEVVDYVDSATAPPRLDCTSDLLFSSGRRVVPALGLSWSHCVNTRIFMSRDDVVTEEEEEEGKECFSGVSEPLNVVGACGCSVLQNGDFRNAKRKVRRKLQVLFAPHLPRSSCDFIIEKCGLHGVVF